MAIDTMDALVASLPGQWRSIFKASQTAEGAGTWHSLWKAAGQPAAGANPPLLSAGSGYTPTDATTGAFAFNNPTGGQLSYLGRMLAAGATVGTLILYDRLWACSGLGTVVTTAQNITTPGNLPTGRDPNTGADVEPWLEVYTAPGATTANWDLTGTDGAGNTNRNWRYVHPANAETVGQMMPMLPGGTTPAAVMGCRQATSFICSASSGTAGNVGITLLRRLVEVPIVLANVAQLQDAFALGKPQIFDDACIAMMVLCTTTNTGVIQGSLNIAQG